MSSNTTNIMKIIAAAGVLASTPVSAEKPGFFSTALGNDEVLRKNAQAEVTELETRKPMGMGLVNQDGTLTEKGAVRKKLQDQMAKSGALSALPAEAEQQTPPPATFPILDGGEAARKTARDAITELKTRKPMGMGLVNQDGTLTEKGTASQRLLNKMTKSGALCALPAQVNK